MSDHQQQRHPGRQQRPPQEDEDWYDEQGGGASIEDETWPPRTRTSAVRYQVTIGQRMQAVPVRRTAIPQRSTATHQRLSPAGRYEHEPLPPSRRGGCLHSRRLVSVGPGMLIMLVGWVALRTLDLVGAPLTVCFSKKVLHNWPTVVQTIGQPSENSRPFVTSSVFSTAIEAGESTRVKKGRPHATDALGE